MIDIAYYIVMSELKKNIMDGKIKDKEWLLDYLNFFRNKKPIIFNVETTNACSMTCYFCPRTKLMTRPVKTMSPKVFENIINQIEPHSRELWFDWVQHAQEYYGVHTDEQSENAFFLYILPKVVVLHGYGDPLLDPHIPEYIAMMTQKEIPSYFSCNPANIQHNKTERAFGNGLDYIKYSIDSMTDSVRGKDKFEWDFHNIMKVLEMKEKRKYETQVIITMIDLGQGSFDELKEKFKGTGVYIYKKSLDQAWMLNKEAPKSIHWSEYCQFPWSSMSVNSSGMVVPCGEFYNGDFTLGDTTKNTLEKIWNSKEYNDFRKMHITTKPDNIHCTDGTCDMKIIGRYL